MKLKFRIIFIFIVLLLLLPYGSWKLKDSHELNVAIVDKTVPNSSYKNHAGFIWLLNHLKYVKQDDNHYLNEKDYYGVIPNENKSYDLKLFNESSTDYDLLYITDLYGVYEEELLFGGLEKQESETIKREVFKGTPIIAEYNTLARITDPQIKNSFSNMLGVAWSGWIGRYFPSLTDKNEIPIWAVNNYEQQMGKEWDLEGPGFIIAHETGELLILSGSDVGLRGNEFSLTEKGEMFFKENIKINYDSWFEIIDVASEESILANFHLDVTKLGAAKLAEKDLASSFAAVVRNETGIYTSHYFAGDFSIKNEGSSLYQYSGLASFMPLPILSNQKETFYWKAYFPMMKKILEDIALNKNTVEGKKSLEVYKEDGVSYNARTNNMDLQIYKDGQWKNLFVKGVNMGMALPGKWFTEFPDNELDYLRWFKMIGEMNSNTIRVYTLMDPAFYRALLTYNENNENPLWLMQEIWPEEEQEDYLEAEYNDAFHKEIEAVVDAIHGNAKIPERSGRAFGQYTANVSPYVLGYLVGRELEPDEVIETDTLNNGFVYEGDYVATPNGSPTESWLAWSCDYLLSYEENTYGWQHPVAIVSWPTLDSLQHDSEWNLEGDREKIYNDKATVDIQNFELGAKMKSGLFGAYHIYPNYPDFMNNEVNYDHYQDEEGRLRYGAYLQDFIVAHQGFPALVAEFGLATGMGNAHHNPDGYHHGGLSEHEQGAGIVRMTKAIYQEGYAGALIFEWMDEWAKKTWTTEPFMIPYEHNVFWHNVIDPEQNYGILAMEPVHPSKFDYLIQGNDRVQTVEMHADQSFLYLRVVTSKPFDWSKEELLIGFDTYDRNRGEFKYRSDLAIEAGTGLEFLLVMKGEEDAKLLVIPSYNIGTQGYASSVSKEGNFEEMVRLINKAGARKDGTAYEAHYENGSILSYGDFEGNTNHWNTEDTILTIRIPWGRLNITDPTTHQVLNDPRNIPIFERDELQTEETEGIQLSVVLVEKAGNKIVESFPGENQVISPYKWERFGAPTYRERLKESYYYIQNYFQSLE